MDARIDLAPDFGRYSSAIRRLWWLIAGVALFVGVLVAIALPGDGDGLSARFSVTKFDQPIHSDFGDVSPQLTVQDQVDELRSLQAAKEVKQANPSAGSVTIGSSNAASTITIRARGSRSEATATIAAYETELKLIRRRAIESAVSAQLDTAERYLADLSTSIDKLSAASLGDNGPTTVEATVAVLERTELIRRRAEDTRTLEALKSLPIAAENGVRQLDARVPTDTTIPRVILAALGAALLTAVAIAVIAFFDRRVRRATDVDRVMGAGSTLAAIDAVVPAPQVAALAAALQHAVPGGGRIQFIGVGGYDPSPLTNAIDNAHLLPDSFEIAAVPGVEADSRAVEAASTSGSNVLVVHVGRGRESELAAGAFAIRRAGGEISGVVLAEAKRSASSLLS